MKNFKPIFLFFVIAFIGCKGNKSPVAEMPVEKVTTWQASTYYDSTGTLVSTYNYLEPIEVSDDEKYPLVLFLHGAGERGNDNEAQLKHIAPLFASDSIRELYPSYVVFPQCPEGQYWGSLDTTEGEWTPSSVLPPEKSLAGVMKLIDNMIGLYQVDTNRIYISGLSMGGFGTFDYLARKPHFFAAAIPICGGGDSDFAVKYSHVPMKIFHGAKDEVVPATLSREMYRALMDAGAKEVEYIEFPEGRHEVWNEAYAHEGLLDWMYGQNKSKQ